MHTHFKLHSIFSTAALLLCSMSGQANVAANETTCGTGDFRDFFHQFVEDPALQQAAITTPLTLQTLTSYPALKINLEEIKNSHYPTVLIPPPDQWGELGLAFEWLPQSKVVLRGQRGEYLRTFVFKRKSCWVLNRIEDWTLGGSQLNNDSNLNMDADSCFKRAKAYEMSTSIAQHTPVRSLFSAALDSYLCAADAGSIEASYLAASLSLSGQAPRLENKIIKALLVAASEQLPESALALSDFYCDEGEYSQERPCINPDKAFQALVKGAKMGSADALNQLGYTYEMGTLTEQDQVQALACYKLAADKGMQRAAKNFNRLISQGVQPNELIKCIEAGR